MANLKRSAACIAFALLMASGSASAHPHVWVTVKSEIVFAPDGSVTGVRHAWTFDDMFSAFATQGIEAKTKGDFTREELQPLAKVNVESLNEYDYFTYAKVNGATKKETFAEPMDYWLSYDSKSGELTLHFTLPLKTPVRARTLDIGVYDPEFFINFAFAEKNAVHLAGAPPQCKATLARPKNDNFPSSLRGLFSSSEANAGMGAQYAQGIVIKCP
jgi:ABC-type uncharacterized transport system substrate-binding protein